jgi:cation transport regulator ChaB
MYYHCLSELPENVKRKLPEQAQMIYFKSFNKYFEEFSKLEPASHTNLSINEKAHKAALASVKLKFPSHNEGH